MNATLANHCGRQRGEGLTGDRPSAAGARWPISSSVRRAVTVHIVASVGMLGDSTGFLAVAMRGATTADAELAAASYERQPRRRRPRTHGDGRRTGEVSVEGAASGCVGRSKAHPPLPAARMSMRAIRPARSE